MWTDSVASGSESAGSSRVQQQDTQGVKLTHTVGQQEPFSWPDYNVILSAVPKHQENSLEHWPVAPAVVLVWLAGQMKWPYGPNSAPGPELDTRSEAELFLPLSFQCTSSRNFKSTHHCATGCLWIPHLGPSLSSSKTTSCLPHRTFSRCSSAPRPFFSPQCRDSPACFASAAAAAAVELPTFDGWMCERPEEPGRNLGGKQESSKEMNNSLNSGDFL